MHLPEIKKMYFKALNTLEFHSASIHKGAKSFSAFSHTHKDCQSLTVKSEKTSMQISS